MVDVDRRVLIACVSPQEGCLLESSLAKTGWSVLRVDDAGHAVRELDGGEQLAVLVIDGGLLEMTHDAQWRVLLEGCPRLGVVVRCLAPRADPPRARDESTFEVHPDDLDGIRRTVRRLGEG